MKLAVPDMISNSYFPAVAAAELGFFKQEGLDVELELLFPVDKAYAALRDGTVDFVAGSAHSALAAFPEWQGAKLICAQAQGMYWFLVMHKDLGVKRGDIAGVKGRSIGAAPWVEMGLRRLLIEAGIDLVRDGVTIAPVPGALGASVNFRRHRRQGAGSAQDRWLLGQWHGHRGRGAARHRHGCARRPRGDGPKACLQLHHGLDRRDRPPDRALAELAAAAVRAIVKTQAALKKDVSLAIDVGRKLFPPAEAELIAELIRRDLPYYDPKITPEFVTDMNRFARDIGILKGEVPYEGVVATQFVQLWGDLDGARYGIWLFHPE